jgi:hypothetical protein
MIEEIRFSMIEEIQLSMIEEIRFSMIEEIQLSMIEEIRFSMIEEIQLANRAFFIYFKKANLHRQLPLKKVIIKGPFQISICLQSLPKSVSTNSFNATKIRLSG